MKLALAVALASLALPVAALELEDVSMGASKADVLKAHPKMICREQQHEAHDEICFAPTTFARHKAVLGVGLWQGRVHMISISDLDPKSAPYVENALIAKFGQPKIKGDPSAWLVDGAALTMSSGTRTSQAGVRAETAEYHKRVKSLAVSDI